MQTIVDELKTAKGEEKERILQKLQAFLDADPEEVGEFERVLKEAGGNKKVKEWKGIADVRRNNLSGNMVVAACCVCGSFANVRSCSGCNGAYYCGKECQKFDWTRHKQACRSVSQTTHQKFAFDVCKWLNTVDGMAQRLRQTAIETANDLVPFVQIVVGENSRRFAYMAGGMTSQEAVDNMKHNLDVMSAEMLRRDNAPLPNGMMRIVVVVFYPGGVYAANSNPLASGVEVVLVCTGTRAACGSKGFRRRSSASRSRRGHRRAPAQGRSAPRGWW